MLYYLGYYHRQRDGVLYKYMVSRVLTEQVKSNELGTNPKL